MPQGFADDAARAAFRDAIGAIEGTSSAEVIVSVRRQSASWIHANFLAGIAAAIAAHAYMLFAAQPFATVSLFGGPIVAGLLVGLASTVVVDLGRWLTPASRRRRAVAAAARAAFVERGVRRTRASTGVLVYVSVVERMAEVIADDGVLAAVAEDEWRTLTAGIDAAIAAGGVATGAALKAMAPVLARALPRGADDLNELPDELHVDEARP